jgi:hypothetical protein
MTMGGVSGFVEPGAVEVQEVGILPFLAAVRAEPQRAGLLVDPRDLHHRAFARRNLVLQLARLQVVEIELPPVIALRVPDHFIAVPQHAPPRA